MRIGRVIYYDKVTGNIILDRGEREGSVVETTVEQDFSSYVALSERVPETVGVIQLEYGQYADKFGVYYYSIDTATNSIVWGDLINPNAPAPVPTLEEQIAQLKNDNLILMDVLATMYEDMLEKGTV